MFAKGFRYLVRGAVGAIAAALIIATLAVPTAKAATVAEFLANPQQVMAQYPNGGAELTALIRDVAVANPQALATITALLSAGTADQQAAVGAGLGQAYNIVLNNDVAYAQQIAAAVGASSSTSAKTSYSGATGNVATASTGPGAGAGGSGAGGGGGGGSGGTAGGSGAGNAPSGGSNSGSSGTTGQGPTQTSGNTFTGGGGGSTGGVNSSGSVSAR